MVSSPLKTRSAAACPLLGAFLFTSSPDNAEIMAFAGYDLLVIDREHVAGDMAEAVHQLRAIRSVSDVPVLVRIRDHGEGSIKPLLDAGYDGIIAANISSTEAARALVTACHYPPLGRRGAHFTVSRAARYGANANYAAETRDTLFLAAMIESRAGFAAIEAIAAVAGIDMLFLGPLDLTADFGEFGDLSSVTLHNTLKEAERRILASGKLLGGALLPGLDANDAARRGYHLVTGASDVSLLTAAASEWLRTKRVSRTSTRSGDFLTQPSVLKRFRQAGSEKSGRQAPALE